MLVNRSRLFDNFFKESKDRQVNHLVLHHIQAKNTLEAISELKKHQVSSHYLITESGEIFLLVEEKNIAYHAGVSFWHGQDGLNQSSIGIEFLSYDPYAIGFTSEQIHSGIKLCQEIIKKYSLEARNIVGHSDIAYYREDGFLNRKDDPSHLFPWKKLAENGIGIYPDLDFDLNCDKILFESEGQDQEIKKLKKKLQNFGYKLRNLDDNFDEEFKNLTIVFNRRFNQKQYLLYHDKWLLSSSKILEKLS